MPNYLLRTQQNDIFKAIEKSGLDPGEFEWSDEPDRDRLRHKPSGFSFEFVESPLHGCYAPSTQGPVAEWFDYRHQLDPWAGAFGELKSWLAQVAREFGAPDLWRTFNRAPGPRPVSLSLTADNTPFTRVEQQRLKRQLPLVGAEIVKAHKSALKHEDYVTRRLEQLSEAVSGMGRRDWAAMVVGVLFQMAMDLGLDAAGAKRLFRMVFHALTGAAKRLALPGV